MGLKRECKDTGSYPSCYHINIADNKKPAGGGFGGGYLFGKTSLMARSGTVCSGSSVCFALPGSSSSSTRIG